MNITQEQTDAFNVSITANTVTLIDTTTDIVVKQNNFTYFTSVDINPIISVQSTPIIPVIIR